MKITLMDGDNMTGPSPANSDRVMAPPKKFKEPSPEDRMVDRAHDARVHAVDDWVNGRISTAKHEEIHRRAKKIIKNKGHK